MLAFQGLQCLLMGQITYMALNAVDHCITITVKSQATHIVFNSLMLLINKLNQTSKPSKSGNQRFIDHEVHRTARFNGYQTNKAADFKAGSNKIQLT